MKKLLTVLGLLLVCGYGFYRLRISQSHFPAAEVTRGSAVLAVYATGVVEPVTWAKLSAQVSAQLNQFLVEEGAVVEPGQLLAALDNREAQARVQQLESKVTLGKNERARLQQLFKTKAVSEEELDRAVRNHEQAEYELAGARVQLGYYELRSPIAGKVLRRDGEIGELLVKEQTVFWVGQEKPLQIVVEVDEENIPLILPGQTVAITADAFPGSATQGTLTRITPKGDPVKKSFRAWVALPDETALRIGMTVEVNVIIREESNALLIPQGAILRESVWKLENGSAQKTLVEAGARGKTGVEILSGLEEGDRVLLAPTDEWPDVFPAVGAASNK